jgi:transposase
VTTLHFENGEEGELRRVGMSKEHRVDPQVQVGLLVDPGGFPLEMHVFEGNKAETTTLIPVLSAFQARHDVKDLVVVADAGMLSASTHLTVVFAALAVARRLQDATGTSIKKIVQTLRTARSATIDINGQRLTLDPDLTDATRAILTRLETGH